jgi:hypothetical protein
VVVVVVEVEVVRAGCKSGGQLSGWPCGLSPDGEQTPVLGRQIEVRTGANCHDQSGLGGWSAATWTVHSVLGSGRETEGFVREISAGTTTLTSRVPCAFPRV